MLANTLEFCREAQHFLKHGYYCNAPEGTSDWKNYWIEQSKRCVNGYQVGDTKITGRMYRFLNFNQIRKTIRGASGKRAANQLVTFPDFLEGQYNFFWLQEIARNGISKEDYDKLGLYIKIKEEDLVGGKHICMAKARQRGFSYITASLSEYEYQFVPNSLCIVCAYDTKYVNINMKMIHDYNDFTNKNTCWGKSQLIRKRDHIKSGFTSTNNDGIEIDDGFKSEIQGITFQNNSSAGRGKNFNLAILEEGGSFNNVEEAVSTLRPGCEKGNYITGQIILFGTGSPDSLGWEGFSNIYYTPGLYNMISVENIWDNETQGTYASFFYPSYQNKEGFYDSNGNSLNEEAKTSEIAIRDEIKKKSRSVKDLQLYIIENPFNAQEAFMKAGGNSFPQVELQKHLGWLETKKRAQDFGKAGELIWSDNKSGLEWKESDSLEPITTYPNKPGKDNTGCIIIYEHPHINEAGFVPDGLYIAGTDPYDQDDEGSGSLGSTFIYKRFLNSEKTRDWIVAEYTGRPDDPQDYYENCRKLLAYYNAKTLYENMMVGLKNYFQQHNSLHLLKPQPKDFIKSIMPNSSVDRSYGIHMTKEIKLTIEQYIKTWLLEKRSDSERGEILNLHTIFSIPLVQELIQYDREKGNFDRIIAFGLTLLHREANYMQQVKEVQIVDPFFKKDIFRKRR